jgi:hypothetical protein
MNHGFFCIERSYEALIELTPENPIGTPKNPVGPMSD